MAANTGTNGNEAEVKSAKDQHLEDLSLAASLLSEEDAGRLATAALLLAGWNEARRLTIEGQSYDEASRTQYHLSQIRKRLSQARRAGMTKAQGGYLATAWANIQRQMRPETAEGANAS